MSALAIVRVRAGRPSFVRDGVGCIISISTHDHYFLTTRAAYKRKLVSLHPDRFPKSKKGGEPYMGGYFRECATAYCRWLAKELQWYRNLGLDLPAKDL